MEGKIMRFNRLAAVSYTHLDVYKRQGMNISDMTNKSRDKYAYTLLDLEHKAEESTIQKLRAIKGVLRVRVDK